MLGVAPRKRGLPIQLPAICECAPLTPFPNVAGSQPVKPNVGRWRHEQPLAEIAGSGSRAPALVGLRVFPARAFTIAEFRRVGTRTFCLGGAYSSAHHRWLHAVE
jgi:hypothetical protein